MFAAGNGWESELCGHIQDSLYTPENIVFMGLDVTLNYDMDDEDMCTDIITLVKSHHTLFTSVYMQFLEFSLYHRMPPKSS
eukprot:11993920-Karenia_brevis.AAC.1